MLSATKPEFGCRTIGPNRATRRIPGSSDSTRRTSAGVEPLAGVCLVQIVLGEDVADTGAARNTARPGAGWPLARTWSTASSTSVLPIDPCGTLLRFAHGTVDKTWMGLSSGFPQVVRVNADPGTTSVVDVATWALSELAACW